MSNIHITGGAGFIGSNLVRHLNARGIKPIIYDDITEDKWRYLRDLKFAYKKKEEAFFDRGFHPGDTLVHLGANVDTTEDMNSDLWENNVNYTTMVFNHLNKIGSINRIYASSAAVYGDDCVLPNEDRTNLKPLNAYAMTKLYLDNNFGEVAIGLRLFNVYGLNEQHKGAMRSIVSKALSPSSGTIPLFEYKGVKPARDFIYVKDVCKIIEFFIRNPRLYGIYNVGTGKEETFEQVVKLAGKQSVAAAIPKVLEGKYQALTRALNLKLRSVGYRDEMFTVEQAIKDMKEQGVN